MARLPLAGDLLVALVATAFATLLRWAIDGLLPGGFPFLTYFPVVLVTAFILGTRAGIVTAVLSGMTTWYLFIPPFGSWELERAGLVAMLFYAFITSTEIALVHWMQRSNHALVAEREANLRLAETRELLFRELQHRVSNNLQTVAALLTVQRRQLADEGARAALDEAARRLQTIGRISRQLYDPSGAGQNLDRFLQDLTRDVIETSNGDRVQHEVVGETGASIAPEAAIPLALVVAESIANAIEHGFTKDQQDCRLQIRLKPVINERLTIEVEDNGRGLPDGFDLASSDSLGLKIATMLAGQLGGKFSLQPAPTRGALARLELPLAA